MNFIFLMDPLDTVNIKKDTSYAFMCESHQRGHRLFYLHKSGITLNKELHFDVQEVVPTKKNDAPFIIKSKLTLTESQSDVLFIRTDPPFDEGYLTNTWLLDRAKNITILNNPTGIRTVNEKIWATQFTEFVPTTLITSSITQLKKFLSEHKKIIIKPTNSFGGQAIFVLEEHSANLNVILELATQKQTTHIIAQTYIPEASIGDKRILLLNGEPLGAVLRVHSKDDHRNNFMAGGNAVKAIITPRETKIIETLKPHLVKLGLFFVGIDIIGDFLIEVNVTSPTCIQEMMELDNKNLAALVIDAIEKKEITCQH